MISLTQALQDARLMQALTGLTPKEFQQLLPVFEHSFKAHRQSLGIRLNFGRPPHLRTMADKLFFILFYLKAYPTFDIMSAIFEMDRHRIHDWVNELLSVLTKALGKKIVLPTRKLRSLDEFFTRFPGVKEIWVDGTERPVRRPKNQAKQKEQYSGKKKRHTVKNLIVSDRKRRILAVTKTTVGKQHDYQEFKEQGLARGIPPNITTWLDTGFQGVRKDFPKVRVKMPKRALRGHALTEREKAANQRLSRRRIFVEHAIGGVKRLRSLTDVLRARRDEFADRLMLAGAGLWNFHLQTR